MTIKSVFASYDDRVLQCAMNTLLARMFADWTKIDKAEGLSYEVTTWHKNEVLRKATRRVAKSFGIAPKDMYAYVEYTYPNGPYDLYLYGSNLK